MNIVIVLIYGCSIELAVDQDLHGVCLQHDAHLAEMYSVPKAVYHDTNMNGPIQHKLASADQLQMQ